MKKIMFNDRYGLTEAVLSGRKTMTRRVVMLPDGLQADDVCNPVMGIDDRGRVYFTVDCIDGKQRDIYPQYQVGEVVAVAQNYEKAQLEFQEEQRHLYRWRVAAVHQTNDLHSIAGWTNKMFVKPFLMPHRIRITDIRMERLQDISREDCLKEGIEASNAPGDAMQTYYVPGLYAKGLEDERILDVFLSPFDAFIALIVRVSGRGTWRRNPWVFAYTMELQKANGF